jgi:hypothetical protein
MGNSPALPASLQVLDLYFNPSHKQPECYFFKWLEREDNKAITQRITVNWNGACPPLCRSGPVFKNLRRCLKHMIIDANHLFNGYRRGLELMFRQTQLRAPYAEYFGLPNVERLTLRNFGVEHRKLFQLIKDSLGLVQITLEECTDPRFFWPNYF